MEEIAAFVDESVMVHVLNRWLNATKMDELRAQNSMVNLRRFVIKAFAINKLTLNITGSFKQFYLN